MSQGDPNTSTRSNGDTEFGGQRRGGTRLEQMRGDNTAATEPMSTRTAEIGANGFGAGLRAQTELFDTLQTIGRQWMDRKSFEAEFTLDLPKRFAGVRSFPDAVATYQQWLSEWLAMGNEHGRRLVSDGQKIVATGVRSFTAPSSAAR
jgi:hypothetical protein